MYCRACGSEVREGSSFCPKCGTNLKVDTEIRQSVEPRREETPSINKETPAVNKDTRDNVIAVVGFVFAFISPIIGLVCSIIGYSNAKSGGRNKNFAIAGIAISAVEIVLCIIGAIIGISVFFWSLSEIPDYAYAIGL